MTDKIASATDVELIIEGTDRDREIDVEEFSIGFDDDYDDRSMKVDQMDYEGSFDVKTEALDKLFEKEFKEWQRLQARALFVLIGLWEDSGREMSVDQYIRNLDGEARLRCLGERSSRETY